LTFNSIQGPHFVLARLRNHGWIPSWNQPVHVH